MTPDLSTRQPPNTGPATFHEGRAAFKRFRAAVAHIAAVPKSAAPRPQPHPRAKTRRKRK